MQAVRPTVRFCSFSPDGQDLALACSDGTIGLWRLAHTAKPYIAVLRAHGEPVRCVAFSPSGLMLASVGDSELSVKLWDFVSGKEKAVLEGHDAPVRHVAFSPR